MNVTITLNEKEARFVGAAFTLGMGTLVGESKEEMACVLKTLLAAAGELDEGELDIVLDDKITSVVNFGFKGGIFGQ